VSFVASWVPDPGLEMCLFSLTIACADETLDVLTYASIQIEWPKSC